MPQAIDMISGLFNKDKVNGDNYSEVYNPCDPCD